MVLEEFWFAGVFVCWCSGLEVVLTGCVFFFALGRGALPALYI